MIGISPRQPLRYLRYLRGACGCMRYAPTGCTLRLFLHSGAGGDAAGLAVGAAALGHVVVVDASRSFLHRCFQVAESPREMHAE